MRFSVNRQQGTGRHHNKVRRSAFLKINGPVFLTLFTDFNFGIPNCRQDNIWHSWFFKVKIQFRLLLLNSTVLLSCASNGTSTDAKIYPRRRTHIFVGKFLVSLVSSVVLFVLFTMKKYDRNKLRISLAWWTLYRCYGCVYTQTINWIGGKKVPRSNHTSHHEKDQASSSFRSVFFTERQG